MSRRSAMISGGALLAGMLIGQTARAQVPPPTQVPPTIVTTIAQIAEPLQTIFAESAVVEPIIRSNMDPHAYVPVRSDIRNATAADVFVYNGLQLEAQMQRLIAQLHKTGTVFSMASFTSANHLYLHYQDQPVLDPHIWMSPPLWQVALSELWLQLTKIMPTATSEAHDRFLTYMQNLSDLDAYVKRIVQTIPQQKRILITSHDAFHYFGRQYGLGIFGIQGISTQSEVGLRKIETLAERIFVDGISSVFIESTVNPQYMNALIEAVRRKGKRLRVAGTLFSDGMGPSGSYTGSYMGMIDHNATIITNALGGDAPKAGMLGLL